MKNLVFESIDELLESKRLTNAKAKAAEDAEKEKEKEKGKETKLADVKDEHAKVEKTKAVKQKESGDDRAKNAIKSLEKQITDARKPGAFETTIEKKVKIKELEAKVEAWKKKMGEAK